MTKNNLTTVEFIARASIKHNNFYDYSKVEYVDGNTKVLIICPLHGEFLQRPANHLFGKKCRPCGIKERSLTQEDFIARAKIIHAIENYDYTKTVYVNLAVKVCVICKIHGEFYPLPTNHLKGNKCPSCAQIERSKSKSLTTEDFISKSIAAHATYGGGIYDYSKVIYKEARGKVCIICKIHGEFYQLAHSHMSGYGCKKCDTENRRLSTAEFINKANAVHGVGKYDYSKVNYIKSTEKVCIICRIHKEFWQVADSHLVGSNCPKCVRLDKIKNLSLTQEEFLSRCAEVHGNRYDYSKAVYVNNRIKVCIICRVHGEYHQKPNYHLLGENCPRCNISKGEDSILKWLIKHNVAFNTEYDFMDLKGPGNYPLLFDFYIPSHNLLIEFDGVQHFRPVRFHGISMERAIEGFKKVLHNDNLKDKYCLDKGIPLLRIGYKDFKRIPEILSQHLLDVPVLEVA